MALRGALVVHYMDCMPAALALGRGTSKSAAFKPILADIRALLTRAGVEAILPWHVSGTVCIAHGCDGLSRSAFLGVFDPDNPADATEFVLRGWRIDPLTPQVRSLLAQIEGCPQEPLPVSEWHMDSFVGRHVLLAPQPSITRHALHMAAESAVLDY